MVQSCPEKKKCIHFKKEGQKELHCLFVVLENAHDKVLVGNCGTETVGSGREVCDGHAGHVCGQ